LQKEKEAAAAAEAASRKSSRPGKGRNPRLEREDEQIEIPKKVSHKLCFPQCCGSGSTGSIFFMGLLDPDPSVRSMDPDPDLDPSITKQKK
jgi:hypothetical protein